MSAEAALVIASSAPICGPERARKIRELASVQLDWAQVVALAQTHGTLPLLMRNLAEICPDSIPPAIRAHLHDQERGIATRNLQMTSELLALSDLFDKRRMPMVPYKGPALAQQLYGDLNLRMSDDLDILVHRQHVPEAISILESRGYTLPTQIRHLSSPYVRLDHHFLMTRADGEVVELHWAFTPPSLSFDFDIEALWNRLGSIVIGGKMLPAIQAEDLALILPVHGAKDFWQRLIWIVDIAQLLHRFPHVDWQQVIDQAKRCGVVRAVLVALFLANDVLDAPLPEEIGREIRRDRTVGNMAAKFRDRLLQPGALRPRERIQFEITIRQRLSDRIRFLFRLTFAPTLGDFELVRLPARFFFLYWPIRCARLFAKYFLRVGSTSSAVRPATEKATGNESS